MSHYAKIIDSIVVDVCVAEQDFIDSLPDADAWVQTSYNTRGGVHYNAETGEPSADQTKALRKNYAGIGYTYDSDRDAFIPEREFSSWILNEETCLWEAPEPRPEIPVNEAGQYTGEYAWSEDEYNAGNGGWVFLEFEGE